MSFLRAGIPVQRARFLKITLAVVLLAIGAGAAFHTLFAQTEVRNPPARRQLRAKSQENRLTKAIWTLELADRFLALAPTRQEAQRERLSALNELPLPLQASSVLLKMPLSAPIDSTDYGVRDAALKSYRTKSVVETWDGVMRQFEAGFPDDPKSALRAEMLLGWLPQRARRFSEGELLGRWSIAELAGDEEFSRRTLDQLKLWSSVLARSHSDSYLTDVTTTLERAPSRADRQLLAMAYRDLEEGIALHSSDCPGARRRLARARNRLDAAGSPAGGLADLYLALCEHTEGGEGGAEERLKGRLNRISGAPYPYLRARLMGSLGILDLKQGLLSQALDLFERAIGESNRAGEPAYAAYLQTYVARVSSHLGHERKAWRARGLALSQSGRIDDPQWLFTVLLDASRAAERMGAPHAALELADELLLRLPPSQAPRALWSEALLHRSQLATRLSTTEEFRAEQGAALLSELDDPAMAWRVSADLRIAETQMREAGDPASAISRLSEVIAYFEERGSSLELADLYRRRADGFLLINRVDLARLDLGRAVGQIEEQRILLPEDSERNSYFDTARAVFEEAMALEEYDPDPTFFYAEQMRSRLMLDHLSSRIRPAVPLSLGELAPAVPPGTTVIEYALLPDRLLVWIVRSHQRSMMMVRVTPRDLNGLIGSFLRQINGLRSRAGSPRSGEELYSKLLAGPLAGIKPGERLVIVPDGPLFHLPFAALKSPASARYLLQDHTVLISPSATMYVHGLKRRPSPPSSWTALAIGDPSVSQVLFPSYSPLPGARKEAMDIAMLYEARPLLGFEATKAATLAALPRAQVLHFAGHGIQSLLLAPGDQDSSEEDRLLTAQEIAQLSLPNLRVVVLSACSTATGQTSRTEAPSSLARAFLMSGATTVIGTLWPIEDSLPPEIFHNFHLYLRQGKDAATALRLALISYNESRGPAGWDDLRTWASFQAIGS